MNFQLRFTVKDRRLNKAQQRIFEQVSPELQPSLEKLFSFASLTAASSAKKKAKKLHLLMKLVILLNSKLFHSSFTRKDVANRKEKLSMKKRMEQREWSHESWKVSEKNEKYANFILSCCFFSESCFAARFHLQCIARQKQQWRKAEDERRGSFGMKIINIFISRSCFPSKLENLEKILFSLACSLLAKTLIFIFPFFRWQSTFFIHSHLQLCVA